MKKTALALILFSLMIAACAPAAAPVAPATAAPSPVPPTETPLPAAPPPTAVPTATEAPPTATEAPPTATEPAPTATSKPVEPAATATSAPTATEAPPTATEAAPTATAIPATATPKPAAGPPVGDAAQGKAIWPTKACIGCHGANAEGGIGPKLAGTGLSYDQVLLRVRTGKSPMPAFPPDQVSDQEVAHIYAWLKSLAP